MQNKRSVIHGHYVFEAQTTRSVPMKDKQSIILRLEKGEKGNNLSAEYGFSMQQISDIRKNKETIMKFPNFLERTRKRS